MCSQTASKLHAQTSTSWTLCAALTEAWPIRLRLRLDFLGFHGKFHSAAVADGTNRDENKGATRRCLV